MKSPICSVCLNSEILCSACQNKVNSGSISEKELDVIRKVNKLSSKIRGDIEIKRIMETDNTIVIVCSPGSSFKVIGKGASNIKTLSKDMGKTIRVIDDSTDQRTLIQNVIFPIPITGFALVYSAGGEKYKITVSTGSLPVSRNSFVEIAKKILGKDVSLEIERSNAKEETVEDKIKRLIKRMA